MARRILSDNPELALPEIPEVGPYAPSWVDRLTAVVERLPVPYCLTYSVLSVAEVTIFHVIGWADGLVPRFQFQPLALLFPIWLWAPLAMITHLNAMALGAVRTFRPLLEVDDETMRQLEYQFTTMPFGPVLKSGLFWSAIYVLIYFAALPNWTRLYPSGLLAAAFWFTAGLITFFTGATIYYHTLRQLQLVSQTVAKVPRFNLFRLAPVYTFSRLTARTAVAWVLLLSFTILVFPFSLNPVPIIIFSVIQIALALAAFILPLWSVHQRLLVEKRQLLADLNLQVEAAIRRLHRDLERDDASAIGGSNDAFEALAAEREIIGRIPTWPWRAGTLTGVISALALPVILFLIQFALERWLGS